MPVNSMHSDYLANTGVWKRSRDVLSGEDAVKAAGEEYLPRLDSQSDEEFRAYVKRASFFNATSRTAEGYLGMIFRRELLVRSAGIPEGFLADVDLAGTLLNGYAKRVVNEVVSVGRCGTLVDWNDAESRAYLVEYRAEDILNWREERRGGRTVPTLVVLKHVFHRTPKRGFKNVSARQHTFGPAPVVGPMRGSNLAKRV